MPGRTCPAPNLPDVLAGMRAELGAGVEYHLTGYAAIITWLLKMGFASSSGGLSLRTVKNWQRFLGLPVSRTPCRGMGQKIGRVWTTNLLLHAWCATRARGLVPVWHHEYVAATAKGQAAVKRRLYPIKYGRIVYQRDVTATRTPLATITAPTPPVNVPLGEPARRWRPPEHGAAPRRGE